MFRAGGGVLCVLLAALPTAGGAAFSCSGGKGADAFASAQRCVCVRCCCWWT